MEKTLEEKLAEAQQQITTLTTERDTLNTRVTELENAGKKTAAAAKLTTLLSESKLPEVAQTRLRNQFKDAVEETGMTEAVEAEKQYIKSLGVTGVRNMGEGPTGDAGKVDLKESFKKLGMNDKEAELAASRR